MPKSILILIFLLQFLAGVAQTSRQATQGLHYSFTHLTTASGLISYQINTAVQDENGYLWVGTNDGLQRYDGVRFKTFRHKDNDSGTLPSNLVWQLMIDKEKKLWVLTSDGKVGMFDTKTFRFLAAGLKLKDEPFFISKAPFKRLIQDEFGNIFLLVPGGEIAAYNKVTNTFEQAIIFSGPPKNLKIRGLAQEPGTHNYWMCTDNLGLAVYNQTSAQLSFAGNNPGNQKAIEQLKNHDHITNIYFDKHHRLWLINAAADTPSVSCYDMNKQQLVLSNFYFDKKELGYHEIRSFFEQKDGTIWIIGQNVFARFQEKEKKFELVYNGYEEEHGIDYLTITCLIEDREQSMWASTANNGIFRYNPAKDFFSNIQYVSHTTNQQGAGGPVSFMPDKDSTLLVGIRDDGFYRFDKNFQQVPLNIKGIPDKNTVVIWDMCRSSDTNIIWMAAQHGIYKYDRNKKSALLFEPALLQHTTVRRIYEDQHGNLWLGTADAGVFKWNREKASKKFEDGLASFTGIPGNRINRFIKDKNGFIWIASNGEGAYMVNPDNDSIQLHLHTHASPDLKLPEQSALSIIDYNDSLVIIGNSNRLMAYNSVHQRLYQLGSPLSGFISSMEKDDNGHLWVSTTTSIYRVTVSTKVFLVQNRNDGLNNDFFLLGSSYVLPDKRMIFGVYGSLIAFLPSAISTTPMFPDLQITGFTVKDKSLRVDSLLHQKVIVLSPEENSMVIDLSVLSFNSGYLLKYRLEGLDKTWKVADQNSQLVYSYLPPNNYTLHVETVDADGKTGERTITLAIRVTPPYWKTWWFYSLLLLLLGLILFRFDFLRTKRREAMQKMRSNIAGNLHREVNTALNNINILSEMAKLKADTNPEKSKEFISQINIKSESMIIAMDDMLWSIDPGNDSMQKTVERLKEFIDSLNTRHGAGIEMVVDRNVERLKLPMQLRHEALLLFKESIYTQVQCGARDIILHITYEKSHLVFSTEFDPEHCNVQQLNNLFYSKEMDRRFKGINAKLNIDNNKSKMLVAMRLPV